MSSTGNQWRGPALLVSTSPVGEADVLVRFFTPSGGAVTALARSLHKSTSRLAASLLPADELEIRLVTGRGARPILAGARVTTDHSCWREDLDLLALYWFMAECAFLSASEQSINQATFQLTANLLRSDPSPLARYGALAVFVLKTQRLHGLLADLSHCVVDGHLLADDEPVHLLPSGEGVIGREAYNKHYARTGGGLVRMEPERLARWRQILGGPLLDYPDLKADELDAALLLHQGARALGDLAGHAVGSAEYLRRQWKLLVFTEILQSQY